MTIVMQTTIVFKQGPKVVAEVVGTKGAELVTVAEAMSVIQVEQFLERLTGLRVHINMTAKMEED